PNPFGRFPIHRLFTGRTGRHSNTIGNPKSWFPGSTAVARLLLISGSTVRVRAHPPRPYMARRIGIFSCQTLHASLVCDRDRNSTLEVDRIADEDSRSPLALLIATCARCAAL